MARTDRCKGRLLQGVIAVETSSRDLSAMCIQATAGTSIPGPWHPRFRNLSGV